MPTSGTFLFDLDTLDLVEEAYEMVGMEVRGGYDLRSARRSLNLLMREWGNRGLNMWTLNEFTIPVPAGTATGTLPFKVIDLLDVYWRTGTGPEQRDQGLSRYSVSQWAQTTNKNMVGWPSQFYINRLQPNPVIYIWPIPSEDGILGGWGLRIMEDVGAYTNTLDVPNRFLPALVSGLAYHLALKSPAAEARIPLLQQEYERQFMLAAEEDRDRASFFMVPDLSSYNR